MAKILLFPDPLGNGLRLGHNPRQFIQTVEQPLSFRVLSQRASRMFFVRNQIHGIFHRSETNGRQRLMWSSQCFYVRGVRRQKSFPILQNQSLQTFFTPKKTIAFLPIHVVVSLALVIERLQQVVENRDFEINRFIIVDRVIGLLFIEKQKLSREK